MATVRYDRVTRIYSRGVPPALDSLELQVEEGEFMVLVGPSGSGKTTALRMLAGLEPVDGGQLLIGERDVVDVAPRDRDIAMVFQNYALYPRKTVADNLGFSLKMHGVAKDERDRRVLEVATMLGLTELLGRRPAALSGGQRQRVAMGRAIVREPKVFLMDEPLSNLDAQLRVQTRSQIAELQRRIGVTTLYVTHDQVEAMTMGHRVAVLRGGILQQCASPRTLYDQPANLFVAGFIGSPAMNLCPVPVEAGSAFLGGTRVPLPGGVQGRERVVLGVRPEHLSLVPNDRAGAVPGRAVMVEELGADAYVHVWVEDQQHPLLVRVPGRSPLEVDSLVALAVGTADVFVFDPATGQRLDTVAA